MQHRRAFDNASLHGDRSRNETGRDSKHTLSLFFMKRFFQLRYLRYKTLLNHLKALWFVLLSQSRPRPSPTILNDKDSFLFLSFCLPLVAETAASSPCHLRCPPLHLLLSFTSRVSRSTSPLPNSTWRSFPVLGLARGHQEVPSTARWLQNLQPWRQLAQSGVTTPAGLWENTELHRPELSRRHVPGVHAWLPRSFQRLWEKRRHSLWSWQLRREEIWATVRRRWWGGQGVALAECFPRHKKGLVKVFAIHFLWLANHRISLYASLCSHWVCQQQQSISRQVWRPLEMMNTKLQNGSPNCGQQRLTCPLALFKQFKQRFPENEIQSNSLLCSYLQVCDFCCSVWKAQTCNCSEWRLCDAEYLRVCATEVMSGQ